LAKIIDIEKIVVTVKSFRDKIDQNVLLSQLKRKETRNYGIGNYPNQIKFCEKIGLIKKENRYFHLTDSGKEFYDIIPLEPGSNVGTKLVGNKTAEQKQFFQKKIEKGMLEMYYADSIVDENFDEGDIKLTFQKSEFEKIDKELSEFLVDVGFVNEQTNSYEVVESGNRIIASKTRKTKITDYQFEKRLAKERKIGRIAENMTVEREKERVSKKFPGLETGIKRVSDDKKYGISAGYDVISYNGEKITIKHDRFIEVKGTSGSKPIFFWSENEISVAKNLGEQYWLYVWINVKEEGGVMPKGFGNSNPKEDGTLLHQIQNPYDKVWLNQNIERTPKITYRFDLENYED